jgi:hypothetical protein
VVINDVTVSVADNDGAGIIFTESDGSTLVEEGDLTDTYSVVLASQPTAAVIITELVDTQVSVLPSALTFSTDNWNIPQTVTVSAVDDDERETMYLPGNISHLVTSLDSFYNGLSLLDLVVTVKDDDRGSEAYIPSAKDTIAKTITIISPTDGEVLSPGSSVTIRWSSSVLDWFINIQYSSDGGVTYDKVATAEIDDGSFLWTVPSTETINGKLLIQMTDLLGVLASSEISIKISSTPIVEGEETGETTEGEEETVVVETPEEKAKKEEIIKLTLPLEEIYGERWRAEIVEKYGALSFSDFPAGVSIGELIKLPDDGDSETQHDSAVYYIGSDYRRHPFPDESVYKSWFMSYYGVRVIEAEKMAAIQLGPLITYRPGSALTKFFSLPNVHSINSDACLHWLSDENIIEAIYGPDWRGLVKDISDAFWSSYCFETINSSVE